MGVKLNTVYQECVGGKEVFGGKEVLVGRISYEK